MTEPHDWPVEQSAKGRLRPWHATAVGYLAVLFRDPREAEQARHSLRDQGVPEDDLRLYDGEETLRIASRLQQERSLLARAVNALVVDRQLRDRWLRAAREGGSFLWIRAPTRNRANRLVALLAESHYESLRYYGDDGVEDVKGPVR